MATVTTPFRDRETWRVYDAGDEYGGTPERISELVAGGYVQSGLVARDEQEKAAEVPTMAQSGNLDGLTVAELRKLAEERGIDVPRRAAKAKLLETLGA